MARKGWMPGDEDYPVRLAPHRVGGKVRGFSVHLTRESIAAALGVPVESVPDDLRAVRIVLDPGTRQILIRLRLTEKEE